MPAGTGAPASGEPADAKDTGAPEALRERLNLQFRAEIFNLLNRANVNAPNLIIFTPPTATNLSGLSATAGTITSTSTTSRLS